MTKKELVEFLQQYPDNTTIAIFCGGEAIVLDDSMSWLMTEEQRSEPPNQNDPWPDPTLLFYLD